jgi:outer membrane protein OmpA-like peptidoglycan-associated protein
MATEKVKVYEEGGPKKGRPLWAWLLPLLLLLALGLWLFSRSHNNTTNETAHNAAPVTDSTKPDQSPGTPGAAAPSWTAASIADAVKQNGRVAFTDGEVHFATASAALAGDSQAVLDQVAQALKNNPDWKMQVVGHTDATGAAPANDRLSQQRAQSVVAYLTSQGVERRRLRVAAAGQRQPATTNATDTGRAENRRVEFIKD